MSDQEIEPNPEEPIVFKKDVDRRSFLKVSGATAGAAAFMGATGRSVLRTLEEISSSEVKDEPNEQIFRCVCRPNCFGLCPLHVHVRDGKIVKTSMAPMNDPKYNRVCLRGLSNVQRIYSPERIKYPMKRAGARGENKWERISWDEAITTISDEFNRIQADYGKQAVSMYTGSGNYAILHGPGPGANARFRNLIGATHIDTSIDVAGLHGQNRVWGPNAWLANDASDLVNANAIFVWGYNLTESTIHQWHFVADALEAGVKLIVIDPVHTIIASKADEYIPIRPGTDTALTLSMMQVIINEDLHNKEFLLAHTVAPFLVREDTKLFLRMSDLGVTPTEGPPDASGKPTIIDPVAVWDPATDMAVAANTIDAPALEGSFVIQEIGVRTAFDFLKEDVNQYPPDVASQLTEIDAEIIVHLARIAANTPVTHMMGYGSQALSNGVHTAHAAATLAAVTGNIGYPGASVGANWESFPFYNRGFVAPSGQFGTTIPELVYRGVVKSGEFKGEPFPIKALYVVFSNLITNCPNNKEWINEVFPKLDLVVVADLTFTDTSKYADIVLPVAHWFEVEDIASSGQTHHLQISQKAIDPPFEAKPDGDIFRLLAEKMGIGEYFAKSNKELMDEVFDSAFCKDAGISVESIQEQTTIRYRPDPFIPFAGAKFSTPSGRMEFYVEKPQPRNNYGQEFDVDRERLPRFFPPQEAWPENPLYEKYPLTLLSERPRFRVHTQWYEAPWLRELEPEPIVKIHIKDAEKRGINNGDHVEVYNDRGYAVAKAVLTSGLRPGVMVYPKGWQLNQHISGHWTFITSSTFDPVGVNSNFMDTLVEVRKWNGEV